MSPFAQSKRRTKRVGESLRLTPAPAVLWWRTSLDLAHVDRPCLWHHGHGKGGRKLRKISSLAFAHIRRFPKGSIKTRRKENKQFTQVWRIQVIFGTFYTTHSVTHNTTLKLFPARFTQCIRYRTTQLSNNHLYLTHVVSWFRKRKGERQIL